MCTNRNVASVMVTISKCLIFPGSGGGVAPCWTWFIMFRRKLTALDYPDPSEEFSDPTAFRRFIVWLEDQKIRHYKVCHAVKYKNRTLSCLKFCSCILPLTVHKFCLKQNLCIVRGRPYITGTYRRIDKIWRHPPACKRTLDLSPTPLQYMRFTPSLSASQL